MQATGRRVLRFRAVRQAGRLSTRFVRQAVPPAMTYGVGVHGAPPQLIDQMRRTLRQSWHTPGSGTSAWITSCLQSSIYSDPQVTAWTAPVHQWALLHRDCAVPDGVLQKAWQRQIRVVYGCSKPWTRVSGPAGATLLALRDLKWTTSAAHLIKTDQGFTLDLTRVAPSSVLNLAREAALRRLWESWAARPLGSAEPMKDREPLGYWLEPILRLLGNEKPPSRPRWKPG